MITVKYFASIRDALGISEEALCYDSNWKTLADLRSSLAARGSIWAEALLEPSVHCARNYALAAWHDPIRDGDEIAFFPPVTGG